MDIPFILENLKKIDAGFLLPLFAKGALLTAVFYCLKKYRLSWRMPVYAVLVIFAVRILLFEQPFSWLAYKSLLATHDISGYRQRSILNHEYDSFLKKKKGLKYLAVGSSQAARIYDHYSRSHDDLALFTLPGFNTLDLAAYKKSMQRYHPEYILLYLSEFDLAYNPALERAVKTPALGLRLFKYYPVLREFAQKTQIESPVLAEIIAGEFFPEYKYGFVFEGFLNKLSGKYAALHPEAQTAADSAQKFERGLKEFYRLMKEKRAMDEEWIPFHLYFLNQFLAGCRQAGIKVIIVEGQYSSKAQNAKTAALHEIVHKHLLEMGEQNQNVWFIPQSPDLSFTEQDFVDPYHVSFRTGGMLGKKIIHIVETGAAAAFKQ